MKRIVKKIAGTAGKRPECSILNPAFVYESSANTDLAAKFAKLRAEQNAAKLPSSIVVIGKRGVK